MTSRNSMDRVTPLRRFILAFFAVLVALLVPLSTAGTVQAAEPSFEVNAQDRVSSFISFASGKQTVDASTSTNITQDELRFLGILMSNFYTPFVTEFGVLRSEDETEDLKTGMIDILQNNLGFDETMADVMAENIINIAGQGSETLQWGFSKEQGKDITKIELSEEAPNMQTLLLGASGQFLNRVSEFQTGNVCPESEKTTTFCKIKNGEYRWGYLMRPGSSEPVFTFDLQGKIITSDVQALMQSVNIIDEPYQSFIASFLDTTVKETGSESIRSLVEDEADAARVFPLITSLYGKLALSPFGDIISVGGNHQIVMIPGAILPATWKAVNDKGEDLSFIAGTSPNQGINFLTMTQLAEGTSGLFTKVADATTVKSNNVLENQVLQNQVNNGNQVIVNLGNSNRTTIASATASASKDLASLLNSSSGSVQGIQLVKSTFAIKQTFTKARSLKDKGMYSQVGTRDSRMSIRNNPIHEKGQGNIATEASVGFLEKMPNSITAFAFKKSYNGPDINNMHLFDYSGPETSSNYMYRNFIWADDLGIYKGENEEASKLPGVSFFTKYSTSGDPSYSTVEKAAADASSAFTSVAVDFTQEASSQVKDMSAGMSSNATFALFLSYAIAGLYNNEDDADLSGTIGKLGYRVNAENLPNIPDKVVELPKGAIADMQLEAIRNWTYYLLHPTSGLRYVTTLISNKVGSVMIGWHTDMVGTDGVGILPGTTQYKGFSGYVTTPSLSDISWLDKLVDIYYDTLIYFILAVVALMGLYAVTGVLTVQQAVAGAILFAVTAWIPAYAINFAINTSNNFATKIYNSKFSYWSLLQHQSYVSLIDSASNAETYESYIQGLYAANAAKGTSTQTEGMNKGNVGGNSIVVKWQAPKKMQSLAIKKETENGGDMFRKGSNVVQGALTALVQRTFSGETYTGDPDEQYLLRSYADLGNWSRFVYKTLSQKAAGVSTDSLGILSEADRSLYDNRNTQRSSDITNNYINAGEATIYDESTYLTAFMSGTVYPKAVSDQLGKAETLTEEQHLGLNQGYFQFDMTDLNNYSGESLCEAVKAEASTTDGFNPCESIDSQDLLGLAAYGLYSESPYYYFSWELYDMGMSSDMASGGYKNLLLEKDQAAFFYNTLNDESEGTNNGALKDFMDFRSLFTYVIPYLREGNAIVEEYYDIYGLTINKGVSTEEGHEEDYADDPVLLQQYWHNINVARLYNIYSPWVDLMTDSSYAQPEEVNFQGEKILIQDPLDPGTYPEDRPMVFSKAEQEAMGLTDGQLTEVERRIQKAQTTLQPAMVKLLNYYNFDDVVLNPAAAMEATFAFNQAFSSQGIVNSINLYPQGFELNDFTYDAFLRLILANSTGYDVTQSVETDYYADLMNQSSFTTTVLLLGNDMVAIYLIPGVKMFFILGIFVMSILLIIASAIKVEENILKNTLKSFIKPLILFLAVSMGHALVISWFMSSGNTQVVEDTGTSIQLGDPAMTLLVLLIINVVVVVLYAKILWTVAKDLKRYGKATFTSIMGVGAGIAAMVSGKASRGASAGTGSGGSGGSGGAGGLNAAKKGAASLAGATGAALARRDKTSMTVDGNLTKSERYTKRSNNDVSRRMKNKKDSQGYTGIGAGMGDQISGTITAGTGRIVQKASGGRWGNNRVNRGNQQRVRGVERQLARQERKDRKRTAREQYRKAETKRDSRESATGRNVHLDEGFEDRRKKRAKKLQERRKKYGQAGTTEQGEDRAERQRKEGSGSWLN